MDIICIEYDQMNGVANTFQQEAGKVKKVLGTLNAQVQVLQGGKWQSNSANKFYQEMNNELLPAVQRLEQALVRAAEVTNEIARIMDAADEEASSFFRFG